MGGSPKALLDLAGTPLLSHVIRRLNAQCSRLLLSVESQDTVWAGFGLPQVVDISPGNQGPLGGVLSAMKALQQDETELLLVPCDAPFLPLDLARRLC